MKFNVLLVVGMTISSLHSMSLSPTRVDALSQSIVVIGLNAALQKRFILPPDTNLEPGNVHRAHRCETGVGGKGQDVGVALSCLLSRKTATRDRTPPDETENGNGVLLAQFLGAGPAGDAVSSALRSRLGGPSSDALTVRNAAPLRTCTTIVGADGATELVETSGSVTRGEMEELRGRVDAMAREGGRADCVCVMGSMPPGCPDDTYADLTSRLAGRESLVLIDSVIGLDPLLTALAAIYDSNDGSEEGAGGAVLKLNAAELCKLAGVAKSSGEADRVTTEELTASARGFVARHASAVGALDYLCVTDGRWPGHLVEVPRSASAGFRTWRLPAVDLSGEGTLYPIGAGDTVAAGTLAAWQRLRRRTGAGGGGDDDSPGVVPPEIGALLSDRMAEWSEAASSSPSEEDGASEMVAAFAFGLACGSASCLQEENSVFEVDDAVNFFTGMTKPIVQ